MYIKKWAKSCIVYVVEAIEDALKKLILPSLERLLRSEKKERSDLNAIDVFGENLKNLLMSPPVKWMNLLWFDPAYRSWCKLAVIDKNWQFLYNDIIYPTPPQNDIVWAEKKLLEIIAKYSIDLIVIWNWTASRESENFVSDVINKNKLDTKYLIVSESWASVYSASKLAQQEYSDLDVTVRWAISIANRVLDPLAEFTKIDPKSLWVWQYQHDVDQKLLKEKLNEIIEDTVNKIWVNLNTANYTLISYVAGLSSTIAKNIVEQKTKLWAFNKKSDLKKVKWLWPKAYEQSVWFFRIKWWSNILDETWIHPDNHEDTYKILENEFWMQKKIIKLPINFENKINKHFIENIADKYNLWYETVNDIFRELQKPWLDPRDDIEPPIFKSEIMDLQNLKEWMILVWKVRNVTDFWAFVDIWMHNDWLVHISQLSNEFIKNPIEIVSVWENVKVKVIWIDYDKEKVQLSMKDL